MEGQSCVGESKVVLHDYIGDHGTCTQDLMTTTLEIGAACQEMKWVLSSGA